MSKLNLACFAIRSVRSILSQETSQIIYFYYIHSIITYGIIFWDNSTSSIKIFRIKKNIVIITNSRTWDSCRDLFKKMKMLPVCSRCIYTVSLYIVNNKHLYTMNMEIHNFNTRYNTNLQPPNCNLTIFQKGLINLE